MTDGATFLAPLGNVAGQSSQLTAPRGDGPLRSRGWSAPTRSRAGKGALTEAVRALQALSFCLQASHERRGLRWLIRVFYCLVTAVTAYCCNRAWQQCS